MEQTFSEAYREKLRNRLKSAKIRTKKKFTAREALDTEDNQLRRDIESHLNARNEWKRSIAEELDAKFIDTNVSTDESLDFFFGTTDTATTDKTTIETKTEEKSPKREGEEAIQMDPKDTRPLVTDIFSSANNWKFFDTNATEIKPRKDRIRDESRFLYTPSDRELDVSDESVVKQELISLNKINGSLSAKNLSKIKSRLVGEGLGDKFLDNNSCFTETNDRIEIKNSIYFDPQIGSDKELVAPSPPTVRSFWEIITDWFKSGEKCEYLVDGKVAASERLKERRFSQSLETLSVDELNQLLQQLRLQEASPQRLNNTTLIKRIEAHKQTVNGSANGVEAAAKSSAKELEFATDEEIENNRRFRLLRYRWEGVSNFKNYRFVPLDEKEIPPDLFDTKPRVQSALSTKRQFEDKREAAIEMLSKVGQQLIKQSSGTADRPRTLEDMVIEEDIMGFSAIGFTLFPVAQQKRPLNPHRKERKKIAINLMGNSDIKIVITIMHGLNVPIRKKDNIPATGGAIGSVGYGGSGSGDTGFPYECKVCPFVEAVFQRESARTNTAEGTKPTWNETFSLKFKAPESDNLCSSLAKISDCIYLNLFDEVILDSGETITSDGQKVIHKRTERRWLGSLKIPFSTLYLNSKIEGTFSLSTPLVLLGYEYDNKSYLLGSDTTTKNTSKQTYLTLFVTIDPSLQSPEPLVIKCDTVESESLELYAKKWQNKLKQEFPNRSIKTLAVNMEAKSVLVCRYLRPLKPPEDFLVNFNVTNDIMARLARFVSLIPKVPDSVALPGVCDIWCACDQFLDMMLGGEEEHAILLCNYFLYLEKRAAILLGYGIPEGLTAYVIVFEYGRDPYVFNASTGEQYSVRDSYIPLNSIGCVITPENIYANISKSDHPNRLNYDISKSADWRPLFGKQYPSPPIVSIQPESLQYTSADFDNAMKLQEKLDKHLRESFMRWRRRNRTFFNRHVIQSIRKMLPRLESAGKVQVNDLIQELHDVFVLHEMTGFPLNMPYNDFDSITEAVFATGVHLAEDKRVEFALTVYVHPYPSSIFSVWVYVAALTRHSDIT